LSDNHIPAEAFPQSEPTAHIAENDLLAWTIEDLSAFHDPTGGIRASLADESGVASPRRLFEYVAEKLYPEEVADLGEHGTGMEMLYMNAVYFGLPSEGLHEYMGLTEDRAIELATIVEERTEALAQAIVTVGSRQAHDMKLPGFEGNEVVAQRTSVNRAMASHAHAGQTRNNNKEFIAHVEGAAAIQRRSWKKVIHAPMRFLYAAQQAIYGHDGPEEAVDPILSYLAKPKPSVMPLVVEKISRLQGDDELIARAIGRSTMTMINIRDVEGQKRDYVLPKDHERYEGAYISQLVAYGRGRQDQDFYGLVRRISRWAKPFDNIQNLYDDPSDKKKQDYQESLRQFSAELGKDASLTHAIKYAKSRWLGAANPGRRAEYEDLRGFDYEAAEKQVDAEYRRQIASE
jgi:hypothetical protein